jgi:hypothetical protein
MKTLKCLIPLFALITLVFFGACKKGTDDDPFVAPPYEMTGTLTIGSETFDLGTWIQGPVSYSSQAKTLNVTMVKENLGNIAMHAQEISNSEVKSTHNFVQMGPNGGSCLITDGSTTKGGQFLSGSFTIDKNEELNDPLIVGDYRLLSGSFTFEGETSNGEAFTGSGTFKNAQAVFL